MTAVDAHDLFSERTTAVLAHLEETGQLKRLQTIEGPMGPTVTLRGFGEVVCLCSNNYLGLANHPEVVEAGHEGLRRYGAGTWGVPPPAVRETWLVSAEAEATTEARGEGARQDQDELVL